MSRTVLAAKSLLPGQVIDEINKKCVHPDKCPKSTSLKKIKKLCQYFHNRLLQYIGIRISCYLFSAELASS